MRITLGSFGSLRRAKTRNRNDEQIDSRMLLPVHISPTVCNESVGLSKTKLAGWSCVIVFVSDFSGTPTPSTQHLPIYFHGIIPTSSVGPCYCPQLSHAATTSTAQFSYPFAGR
ncbi:plk/plk-unclassified protein kinase [Pseudozyma hubeiensis SY62]|uniref:Plk/plk-unclassified protein kinase n=1 Tax=Pseudozyma hubeiensis (strain SY62) TaxID=1305764 RepID=R9PL97_PSEHS|nr:plk/plk-unclassified protein kinase [Pseudozyma hubeiensis SY62]GAC98845.1 plk/plk-unclassified protein kinase [Pseudozyma hubeiensis SY62]